MNTVGTMSTI